MIASNQAPANLAAIDSFDLFSEDTTNFLSRFQVAVPTAIADLTATKKYSELANSYEPSDFDVVCGRGKGSYNRPGNRRFRAIVQQHIPQYLASKTKLDKTLLLSSIVDLVRQQNDGKARFIKHDKKSQSWVEISDDAAREKVGHAVREAIAASKESAPIPLLTKSEGRIPIHPFEMNTQRFDMVVLLEKGSSASVVSI